MNHIIIQLYADGIIAMEHYAKGLSFPFTFFFNLNNDPEKAGRLIHTIEKIATFSDNPYHPEKYQNSRYLWSIVIKDGKIISYNRWKD